MLPSVKLPLILAAGLGAAAFPCLLAVVGSPTRRTLQSPLKPQTRRSCGCTSLG